MRSPFPPIWFPSVFSSTVASFALVACTVGPIYSEPIPATPSAWQAELPHNGNIDTLHNWWQQFNDPVVAQLIEFSEADSPTLMKAWADIEKARATLTNARAAGLPSLDGNASLTRSRQQTMPANVTTSTTRNVGVDAAWEIDLYAKARHGAESAAARTQARVADWHDARVSLAAEVADTYVQYRACELLVDTYELERFSAAETEKATVAAVRAGFNAEADATLASASLANTTSTLLSQRAQCDLLVKSLVDLTGRDELALRWVMFKRKAGDGFSSDPLPTPVSLKVQSVPANAVRQRPDIASLERDLAASSAEIGVAQADLYPSVSLSGSISISAAPATSTLTTWSLGPSLSIPLFDVSKRRAAVVSAQANYQIALANFRQGVRTAIKEVESSLVNLDSTSRRVEEAKHAAKDYRRYLQITEMHWHAGGESLLTLEEARRSALSAEINLITLQRDHIEYWIALYRALGGGWQSDTPASSPTNISMEAVRTNP